MCGLFGIASEHTLTYSQIKDFTMLGTVSYPRGKDSTGLCVTKMEKGVIHHYVKKEVSPPNEFMHMQDVQKMMEVGNTRAIIGHNRAATIGSISKENAHPFIVDDFIGVHNGTIPYFSKEANKRDVTDSQILFESINEFGIDIALSNLPNNEKTAYAIVMIDKETGVITFVRNEQRPLWCIWSKNNKTLMWSSEDTMLEFVCARSQSVWGEVMRFVPNKIYTYDMSLGLFNERENRNLKKSSYVVHRKHTTPKVEHKIVATSSNENTVLTKEPIKTSVPAIPVEPARSSDAQRLKEHSAFVLDSFKPRKTTGNFFKDKYGSFISRSSMENLVKEGCAMTGNIPDIDLEPIFFIQDGGFICLNAVDNAISSGLIDLHSLIPGGVVTEDAPWH